IGRVTPDTLTFPRHKSSFGPTNNCHIFSGPAVAAWVLCSLASEVETATGTRRQIMETLLQGLVIIGGLTFSLAASLLIEELIFGRIVRLAFASRPFASGLGRQPG